MLMKVRAQKKRKRTLRMQHKARLIMVVVAVGVVLLKPLESPVLLPHRVVDHQDVRKWLRAGVLEND